MQTPRNAVAFIAVIASGLAVISTTTSANAGPGQKDGMKPGKRMGGAKMVQELNLTDAQKTKMMTIQTDSLKQRKAIMENTALTQDQKKSQMKTLMMSSMEKMKTILTPDQKKMLEKKMAEQRGKMKTMQAKKGAAPVAPKQ